MTLWGGVEAGGTKFVCAVGSGPDDLRAEVRIPTRGPEETLDRAIAFFRQAHQEHGELQSIGIGSFGPLDLEPSSPARGTITVTPKPGWQGVDISSAFADALGRPVALDTDVNAAALGELRWGAARGLDSVVYVTVGTGIGGGGVIHGRPIHGLQHPEMGHMRLPRFEGDDFAGICSRHGDCLEGLASGPAIEARWNQRGETLPDDHPAWEIEAYYLAVFAVNVMLTLAPRRFIFGGGVMQRMHLLAAVRQQIEDRLASSVAYLGIERLSSYLVPPELGPRAGVLGAIALAQQADD